MQIRTLIVVVAGFLAAPSALGAASFRFMDYGPVYAVTPDGLTGAGAFQLASSGWSTTWDVSSGQALQTLGYVGRGGPNDGAFAITPGGSTAGGFVEYDPIAQGGGPVKWSLQPGVHPPSILLPPGPRGYTAWGDGVRGLTADGVIAVGQSGGQASVWNGLSVAVVDPWSADVSRFNAITPSGSRAVGYHATFGGEFSSRALIWTPAGGPVDLPGWNPDHPEDQAEAISADGLSIVGYAAGASPAEGVHLALWRIDPVNETVTLIDLADGTPFVTPGLPAAISADGSVIGGSAQLGGPDAPYEAVIWTEATGLVRVADLLVQQGALQEAIQLDSVTGISADGRALVGNWFDGFITHGWAATGVRIGAECTPDLTEDGLVDFSDYLEFLSLYDAADPAVDFNQDGLVDFSDYLEFLNLYEAGC